MNEITTTEIYAALKTLKAEHKNNWLSFNSKIDKALTTISVENDGKTVELTFSEDEDVTDFASAEVFEKAGFTAAEAQAMVFVLTQDDTFGMAVNSRGMIERYFAYTLK
jgi:hypothetical protein